jgi:RNA polymerase sigma-70 factor (ECF subfamily)
MKIEDFESFLKANEARIYHYLLTILANESDAQDIVQEAFLAFYEHIDAIDAATALPYLYRIAHNKALTFIKQRKRYVPRDPQDFMNLPDKAASNPEKDYSALKTAITELPIRLATVIHLQYYDRMSYKEMATHLGISVKAVESLIVRAKKILRKKLVQDL